MKKEVLAIVFVFLAIVPIQIFGQSPDETTRIKRLADLCEIWGSIKYFHPVLAYRNDIDWDDALIKTIPKVRVAKTSAEYESALQSMLDVLGDPSTKIVKTPSETNTSLNQEVLKIVTIPIENGNLIIIKTGNYISLSRPEIRKKIADLLPEIPKAKAIVFDLRAPFPTGSFGNSQLVDTFSELERFISTTQLSSPSERSRIHYGFEPQTGNTSGGYNSGFYVKDGKTIRPLPTAKDVPSVFLVNENSGFLVSTLGMQANGKGLVVFEGDNANSSSLTTVRFPITDGLSVKMRNTELINADGTDGEIQPDVIVAKSQDKTDKALEKALELAKNFKPSTVTRKKLPSGSAPIRDLTYPDMKNPSLEYRLLAMFRIWNIFDHFFPYKNLMDKKWDQVLLDFIPKFEQAKDSREYALAVTEMLTYTNDSHVRASGAVIRETFGGSSIPVQIRMVEGLPTVFRYVNEEAAKATGIELGDVILKVDGEDAKTRLNWYAKYTTGSNESSKMFFAANTFTRGEETSIVTLTVRTRTGQEKEVKMQRKAEFTFQGDERASEIYKLISPDIGYADLDRLTVPMLNEVLEKFKDTKAIIFDMRGYPNGIAWALAPRLTEKENVIAAFFERPIVRLLNQSAEAFYQQIPPKQPNDSLYKGKTVMLVDEWTISQSEHTGLFLRAANGTKFIGSQTAGANGDVTAFYIPGGILISFTGQSVKFPDGKQLQRIGLVPDIEVKPTIKGIQAGKDEVLEKAVKYLETELKRDK